MLWPQRSDCALEYSSVPTAHLLPTYYLPPETQGLRSIHNSCLCVFFGYMVSVDGFHLACCRRSIYQRVDTKAMPL